MRERGHAIPAKGWWLNLARSNIRNDRRDLITLGKDLARHVKGKKTPFSYTALSNFVLGKSAATVELADALCREYRLPPAVFFPASYAEAVEMLGTSERFEMLGTSERFERMAVTEVAEDPTEPLPIGARRPRKQKNTAAPGAAASVDHPSRRRSRG